MTSEAIGSILNDKTKLLSEIYFQLQALCEAKYTVLIPSSSLNEVGSFFEVYEVNNEEMKIGKAKEVAEFLNIQLTRKNKTILENSLQNPLLAGVPTVSIERYLSYLVQSKKNTPLCWFDSKGLSPISVAILPILSLRGRILITSPKRAKITSPHCSSIKNHGVYSVGYAAIDVGTGKTLINEIHGTQEDKTYALDEVFTLLQSYQTSEVVVTLFRSNRCRRGQSLFGD